MLGRRLNDEMILSNITNLKWKNALGELVIVTLGVLMALAIDQWNDSRLDRAEERNIVDRIMLDLDADLTNITRAIGLLQEKEASLNRLKNSLQSDLSTVNGRQLLVDAVMGANFGWNQGRAQSTSFEEATNSGRFSLIRDSDIRTKISRYYLNWVDDINRADERETEFPALSYSLVPRRLSSLSNEAADGGFGILSFDPDTPEEDIAGLVQSVAESDLSNLILGELNFARFVQAMMADFYTGASDLKAELEKYRNSLD